MRGALALAMILGLSGPLQAADDNPELPAFEQALFNLRVVAGICYGFVKVDTRLIVDKLTDYWAEVGDGTMPDDGGQILGMREELRKLSADDARQTCIEHLNPAVADYQEARTNVLKAMGAQVRNPPEIPDRDW